MIRWRMQQSLRAKRFYTFRSDPANRSADSSCNFALNFNGLLGDYDMSVFMYHPLNQPLGVYIKSLTDAQTNADNSALSFVYAVLMMIISGQLFILSMEEEIKQKVKK